MLERPVLGTFVGATALVLLAACGGVAASPLPALAPVAGSQRLGDVAPKSKYVYVADRTRERLLVYPAYQNDPAPIRTLGAAQGIVEIGGVAVDEQGHVFVANGSGADVLEFTSGAAQLVRKYTHSLSHPVNVAVAKNGTVDVVDQDDHYPYGVNSSIVEFRKETNRVETIVLDPNPNLYPLHGVAVDPRGKVWSSPSQTGDLWPPPSSDCSMPAQNQVYDFVFPTLIIQITLTKNTQVWGMAIDRGVIYAADYCGSVQKYAYDGWKSLGAVAHSGHKPFYVTASRDHLILIPCAGSGEEGYVTVTSDAGYATIRRGLRGPIGAAAGP